MQKTSRKLLLLILVMAMGISSSQILLGDSTKTEPQEKINQEMASYITPDAVIAGIIHPKQILGNPDLSFLPIKEITREILNETGIDPADIELIVLTSQNYPDSQNRSKPKMGIVFRMSKPYKLDQLKGHMVRRLEKSTYEGRPSLASKHPSDPTIYMPDDRTLIIATPSTLDAMIANHKETKKGFVRKLIDTIDPSSHVAVAFDTKPTHAILTALTKSPLASSDSDHLENLPKQINAMRIQAKALDNPFLTVDFLANSEENAKKVKDVTVSLVKTARTLLDTNLQKAREHTEDPDEQAELKRWGQLHDAIEKNLKPSVKGTVVTWTLTLPRQKQIELLKELVKKPEKKKKTKRDKPVPEYDYQPMPD